MKSFAFYYKPCNNEGPDNIDISELHINIWKVDVGKY